MMKFALISALCVASTMAAPKVSNDGGNLQLNGGAGKVCFTYNDGTATAATGCMADLATTEAVNTQMVSVCGRPPAASEAGFAVHTMPLSRLAPFSAKLNSSFFALHL